MVWNQANKKYEVDVESDIWYVITAKSQIRHI